MDGQEAVATESVEQAETPAPEVAEQEQIQESPFAEGADDNVPAPEPEATDAGQADQQPDDDKKQAAQPVFSAELLQRARSLGYAESEVRELFASPEAADRALTRLEAKFGKAEEKKEEAQPEQAKDEFKLEFSEDFDPEAKKQIETLHGHYKSQVDGLRQELNQVMAFVNQQQMKALEDQLDGMFGELGPEYEEHVGKGKLSELDGDAKQKRLAVIQEMDVLENAYRNTGRQVPPAKELLERALSFVVKIDQKKAVRKEITAKLVSAKKGMAVRANSKNENTLPPELRAARAIAPMLENMGSTPAAE